MSVPLTPSVKILARLGSAVVHAEEILSDPATARMVNDLDRAAFWGLVNDPEVKEWIAQMDKKALIAVRR